MCGRPFFAYLRYFSDPAEQGICVTLSLRIDEVYFRGVFFGASAVDPKRHLIPGLYAKKYVFT